MIDAGNIGMLVQMSRMDLVRTDDITSGYKTSLSRRRGEDDIKAASPKLGDIVFDGGT